MKIKPRLYLLVAAASALMPLQAQDLLWYANPNRTEPNNNPVENSFYRFDGGEAGDCNPDLGNMPSAIVPPGTAQWRVNKPKGRKRAELAQTLGEGTGGRYAPKENEGIYIGYRWKMTSVPALAAGATVFQWKSASADNIQNYPLYAMYNGSQLSFSMVGDNYRGVGSIADHTTKIWTRAVAPDTWVNLIIYIYPSSVRSSGRVRLWFNGVPQDLINTNPAGAEVSLSGDGKAAIGRTWDVGGNYLKWGAYNGGVCNYNITAYLERMRIGKTLESVNPSNFPN